uniref:Ovule protein n=1 Tax=Heterorhabditis bacteriophora TaxID=37862 RepID=A0A1I7W9M2_HETBA
MQVKVGHGIIFPLILYAGIYENVFLDKIIYPQHGNRIVIIGYRESEAKENMKGLRYFLKVFIEITLQVLQIWRTTTELSTINCLDHNNVSSQRF